MIVIARQISLVSAFLFTFLLFKILIIETQNRLGGVTYSTPQTKKTTPSLEEIALILYLPPPQKR